RHLVAFLGSGRALRETAAGLVPVLATAVGLAVTVFSGVLLSTLADGIQSESAARVGAEPRIDSGQLLPAQLEAIAAIEGINTMAGVHTESRVSGLTAGGLGSDARVRIMLTDTATLAKVQEGIPGAIAFDHDM